MRIFGSLVPCRIFSLGQPPRFATWLTKQFGLACPPLLTGCYAITQSTVNSLLSGLLSAHSTLSILSAPSTPNSGTAAGDRNPLFPILLPSALSKIASFPTYLPSTKKTSDFSELAPLTLVITLFIFSFSPTLTTKTASLSPTLPQSNPGYLRKKEPNIISIAKLIRPVQLITIWPCYKFIHELFCPS